MVYSKKHLESLALIRKTLMAVALGAFFCQLLLDISTANIVSNLMALAAFVLACGAVFSHRNRSVGSALSATVIFLMISANSLAPMIGTLLEGSPITKMLSVPVEVFQHRLIFALCLIIAHYLSRSASSSYIRYTASRLSSSLNIRVVLSAKSLWVIGAVGLTAVLFKFLHIPEPLAKFFDGFKYLMMAPFLMLLPPYYSRALMARQRTGLILYYLLQVAFSLVFNSRMAMVLPVGIVAAGWLLSVLTGDIIVNRKLMRTGLLRGIAGFFIVGQFADLSTAILIERDQRTTRSASEQVTATFNTFFDKQAIANYKSESLELLKGVSGTEEWQENYIRNPFLGRFIQVKYDDNCFYRIAAFSKSDLDVLREFTFDRIAVTFPQPVLRLLAIRIDKKAVNSLSIGDEIDLLYDEGDPGFKTGSIPSHAFALFSWAYPFVLVFLYYLIFSIYNGFFTPLKAMSRRHTPTLALLLAFSTYVDISQDGVDGLVGMLLRGIIQIILIYAIALWIVRQLKFPVKMRDRLTRTPNQVKNNRLSV